MEGDDSEEGRFIMTMPGMRSVQQGLLLKDKVVEQ
jgi:hypothetical protein